MYIQQVRVAQKLCETRDICESISLARWLIGIFAMLCYEEQNINLREAHRSPKHMVCGWLSHWGTHPESC